MLYHFEKKGFTLAEVLIVLSVIGFVAVLTLPTILKYTEDRELRNGFKRSYADLTAINLMVRKDYDGDLSANITSLTDLRDKYKKYFKVIKSCDDSSAEGCWHQANKWKELDGTQNGDEAYPGLVLNNGVLVVFENYFSSNCDSSAGATSAKTTLPNVCNDIMIDVNGYNQPNTIGRDIFYAWILSNSIRPWGNPKDVGDANSNTCDPSKGGWGCAHLILTGKDNY